MKRVTFLILIFLRIICYSQSNYKLGFVIKNSGDTIHGLIDSRGVKRMSKICKFKNDKKEKAIVFSPNDINSFSFNNGKKYISKTIIRNNNKPEKVFLEFIVNGKANLYYLKDNKKGYFFIQNENDSLIELINSEVNIRINNIDYLRDRKEYIGILKNVFQDCAEIQPNIENVDLNHKALIKLTTDYHNYVCKDYDCIIYKKDTKPKYSIGILLGVYNSTIHFTKKNYLYRFFNSENFTCRYSSPIGLSVSQRNFFGINNNINLNFHLLYGKYKYKSDSTSIELKVIELPMFISYSFPIGSFKPIINLGINNSFLIESIASSSDYKFVNRIPASFGKYQFSSLFGIGFDYQRTNFNYTLYINYLIGNGYNREHVRRNYIS